MILGTDVILTTKAHSNLDALYGPYFIGNKEDNPGNYKLFDDFTNLEDYIDKLKSLGLTVGIINEDGEVSEYWFLNEENLENPGEFNLVLTEKGIPTKLRLVSLIVDPEYDSSTDSYTVTLHYNSIGNVLLGTVIFYRDNIPLRSDNANYNSSGGDYIILNETIGVHTYKVEITNLYGQSTFAEVPEFSIGLLKIIPTQSFNELKRIKRTPEKINFNLEIELLSEEIESVKIISNTGDEYLDIFSLLTLNETETVLIDLSYNLSIGGKILYLIAYNGDGERIYSYELFNVLDKLTLFVSANKNNSFTENIPATIYFTFSSGASLITNISATGDFTLYNGGSRNLSIDDDGEITVPWTIIPKLLLSGEDVCNNAEIQFTYTIEGQTKTTDSIILGTINKYIQSERNIDWNSISTIDGVYNSCYIDFTTTGLYRTDNSDNIIVKFNSNMYITNDVIHVDDIEIATPLAEEIYIGLGYRLYDINSNFDDTPTLFRYNCICINGMIVRMSKYKVVLSEEGEYLNGWTPNIDINSLNIKNNNGNLCRGIWAQTDTPISLFDNNIGKFLFEANYESDFNITQQTNSCATLKLIARDPTPQELLIYKNNYTWKSGKLNTNVIFGNIEDGLSKYNKNVISDLTNLETILQISGNKIKLFKISTSLKEEYKDLQKIWGVFCGYEYTKNETTKSGTVVVYTLGTSTLQYPIPNFRLNFDENPQFLEGVSDTFLTAKADYMESAHLNNTPLAMLYNKVLTSNEWKSSYDRSPAIKDLKFDAILGEPVIIIIKDKDSDKSINLGSFMLNTDKNSPSMGLEICDGLISLEGHSNDDSQTSSRFTYPEGMDPPSSSSDIIAFLKAGIEDRTLRSNNSEETEDALWLKFYNNYWLPIHNGFPLDNFDDLVSKDYCCLYIIFMMIFGMTDNMGKNAMFDIWKQDGTWGKMFPRFYDLDSSCGLDNNGDLAVVPFVLISKEWCHTINTSLNGDGQDLINQGNNNIFSYKHIKNSQMYKYSSPDSKLWKYVWDNNKSYINTMYKKLRETILSTLELLTFFEDTIIKVIPYYLYNKDLVNKYLGLRPGEAGDVLSKMFGNRWTDFKDWLLARLAFCDSFFEYKNPTYKVNGTVFIRPTYMFPAYASASALLVAGSKNWGFGYLPVVKVGGLGNIESLTSLADSIVININMFDNSDYSSGNVDDYEFTNLKELTLGGKILPDLTKCINLRKLTLTPSCAIGDKIIVPKSVKTLIRKADSLSAALKIQLPEKDSEAQFSDSELQVIDLEKIHFTDNVDLSIYTKLLQITLSDCTFDSNTTLTLPKTNLTFKATNCIFNNITVEDATIDALELNNLTIKTINLSGNITRLDLYKSTIGEGVTDGLLDLTNVKNIRYLNLVGSNIKTVIVNDTTFEHGTGSSLVLGVLESLLQTFRKLEDGNNDIVNLDIFADILNLKSIINYSSNVTNPISSLRHLIFKEEHYYGTELENALEQSFSLVELPGLSFGFTKIKEVKHTNTNITRIEGCAMFTWCEELIKVWSSHPLTLSSDYIFCNCPKLESLKETPSSSVNIKIDKFKAAYAEDKLPYDQIEDSLTSTANNADFSYFMIHSLIEDPITINTIKYPTIYHIDKAFSMPRDNEFNQILGKLRKITINGIFKLHSTCTSINAIFNGVGANSNQLLLVILEDEDLFDNYDNITSALFAFTYCKVKNISILNKLTNLRNASSMYGGATISDQTFSGDKIILNNTNLNNLKSIFNRTTFIGIDSIIVDDFIKNITSNEIHIEACFYDCKNESGKIIAIVNNELNVNENTSIVYINGFVGVSTRTNTDTYTYIFNNDNSKLQIDYINNNYGLRGSNSNEKQIGPFSNRNTNVRSITLTGDLRYYLYGVYSSELALTLNNVTNLSYFCYGASGIKFALRSSGTTITSSGSFDAEAAFMLCNFYDAGTSFLPSDILNNVRKASRMFAASNLTRITFNLTNTITDVTSMFSLCKSLMGGIDEDVNDNNEKDVSAFYENLSHDVTDFTRIFYNTLITTINTDSNSSKRLLPYWAEKAEGSFALINLVSLSGKTFLSIIVDCNLLKKMRGIFAASSALQIETLNIGNEVDMSYAFTFDDYNSIISQIESKIENSYAMFAKWQNDTSATIPSGTSITGNAWYGWNTTTVEKPETNNYYYNSTSLADRASNNIKLDTI